MSKKRPPSIESIIAVITTLSTRENKSLSEVREETGYSLSALELTASFLQKQGLVKSQRGPGGGYRLTKTHDDLKLKDLISFLPKSHRIQTKTFMILSDMSLSDFIKAL